MGMARGTKASPRRKPLGYRIHPAVFTHKNSPRGRGCSLTSGGSLLGVFLLDISTYLGQLYYSWAVSVGFGEELLVLPEADSRLDLRN